MAKSTELLQEYGDAFRAYVDTVGKSWAVESFDEAYNGEWESEKDFTYELVDDLGYLQEMPDNLRFYFDYDAFTRDLFISDYFSTRYNGTLYVFRNM